jgi:hypothetical protein
MERSEEETPQSEMERPKKKMNLANDSQFKILFQNWIGSGISKSILKNIYFNDPNTTVLYIQSKFQEILTL